MDSEYFASSPFALTAKREDAKCWSGHIEVKARIDGMARSLARREDSTFEAVWANLGAGKSHALYHLRSLMVDADEWSDRFIPVCIEMPHQLKKFKDIYARIIGAIPDNVLGPVLGKVTGGGLAANLHRAGRVLTHGVESDRAIVRSYITGEAPHLRELRAVAGIDSRIETDAQATDTLCMVIAAMGESRRRLVLMVDEFQRCGVLRQTTREAVLSCLRTLFSQNPSYLTVVLAMMCRLESSATELIPDELKTLLGRKPFITLPEFDEDEAYRFVIGRFKYFRKSNYDGPDTTPFTEDGIRAVIESVGLNSRTPLIPRHILGALGDVVDMVQAVNIDREAVLKVLAKPDGKE